MTFLTELEKLKAAATEGPWAAEFDGDCSFLKNPSEGIAAIYSHMQDTDAVFIAFLRNHADAITELVRAAENVLIGGNHLASLIGNHPPAGTDIQAVQRFYLPHHPKMYEAWCCWNTIMQLREALGALNKENT